MNKKQAKKIRRFANEKMANGTPEKREDYYKKLKKIYKLTKGHK